jgi:hypothetical protein
MLSGIHPYLTHQKGLFDEYARLLEKYVIVFGASRGAAIFAASLRPSSAGRRMATKVPGVDVPLTVRLGTSDATVLYDIFFRHEYGWKFSASPKVIIDAGGYTGLSAAFFALQYPDATIIAIEPSQDNFELLQINTARFPNVHAVNAAVWQESGTISLTDPGYDAWGFQVTENVEDPIAADGTTGAVSQPVRGVPLLGSYDLSFLLV